MTNIPKLVEGLRKEFVSLNEMLDFAVEGSNKYNTMMETFIGGTIHERHGIEVYDQYVNWKLDSR